MRQWVLPWCIPGRMFNVLMGGALRAEKRLSKTEPGKGWVDRRGNLKEGTHIILNVGPGFDLRGEGALPRTRRRAASAVAAAPAFMRVVAA